MSAEEWHPSLGELVQFDVRDDARALLEESAIRWRRDWDALLVGFVLGVLATLAIQGVW